MSASYWLIAYHRLMCTEIGIPGIGHFLETLSVVCMALTIIPRLALFYVLRTKNWSRSTCLRHQFLLASQFLRKQSFGVYGVLVIILKRENSFAIAFSASFQITSIMYKSLHMLLFSDLHVGNKDAPFSARVITWNTLDALDISGCDASRIWVPCMFVLNRKRELELVTQKVFRI